MSNFQKNFKKIRNVLRDLFIPPLIYKILRNKKESKYEGLHGLDQSLQKYLNFKNGFFVELGANNGVLQSNTLFFEKFKGWTGVLVEPVLHNFFECKKNRPNSKVYCYACTSFDYKDRFVEVIYSNLMSVPRGLESDILDPVSHAHDGLKFLGANEDNIYFGAAACALNLILEKANAPSVIDLLSLDVEGAEIEVLKGIDHSKFRFKFCVIESRNYEKLNQFMNQNHYVFVEKLSIHDYLFQDLSSR